MMAGGLQAPPVLSTLETHLLEFSKVPLGHPLNHPRSDEELRITYDIDRTLKEIRQGRWRRVALQFPDEMLPDAPRVFQLLSHGLAIHDRSPSIKHETGCYNNAGAESTRRLGEEEVQERAESMAKTTVIQDCSEEKIPPKLYILADTSYGACCVDEVAAEHVDADDSDVGPVRTRDFDGAVLRAGHGGRPGPVGRADRGVRAAGNG